MSNEKIIEDLRTAVTMELTAAHQYQLHAHVLENWGLGKLARKMRAEMQEELGHSDSFIERIMFLNGEPEIAFAKTPKKAESLREMFEMDRADEADAIGFYTRAAINADSVGDIGTRLLFERVMSDEESHQGWLDKQLALLERLGEKTFSGKYADFDLDDGE